MSCIPCSFQKERSLTLKPKSVATVAALSMAVIALLSSVGCSGKQEGEDVMARVNGRKITRTEVEKYFDNQTAESPQKPSQEQVAEDKLLADENTGRDVTKIQVGRKNIRLMLATENLTG